MKLVAEISGLARIILWRIPRRNDDKEGANVKETQFQFLIMLVSRMGAIVIGELLTISSRLRKIYDAIGVWGTSIESEISRLRH